MENREEMAGVFKDYINQLIISKEILGFIELNIELYKASRSIEYNEEKEHFGSEFMTILMRILKFMPNYVEKSNLLKHEIDSVMNISYAQNLVNLYSNMESTIKSFVILMLKENKKILKNEPFNQIKIPFGDFMILDEVDRYDLLYKEYEKKVTKGCSYGVDRFNRLLKPIQYDVIPSSIEKKQINELAQLRNCLLHRGGVVDQHFLLNTNTKFKLGDKIIINKKLYDKYSSASMSYVMKIVEKLEDEKK